MNRKSVDKSVDGKPVTVSKGSVLYWQARVRKTGSNQFYSVPIQHAGRRMEMSLGTANLFEAAQAAKERYRFLVANGWDAFLKKYRPDKPTTKAFERVRNVTVGQFIQAVRDSAELEPKTIDDYAVCLRRIVADLFGIDGGKNRFGYRGPKYQKWLDKVHAVRLAELTPERIRAWKKTFIDRAGKDEAGRRRLALNANSYLRRSRALFSQRNVIQHLKGLELPAVLPFDGIEIERITTKFYGAGVEPRGLLRDALAELGTEELKAFILSLTMGLRRREADMLEWASIDLAAGTVQIVPTEYFKPKTAESVGLLPIEPEFLPMFRGWKAKASGPFVIESERKPKAPEYQWYRAQETFDSLLAWLRKKGVTAHKPFHALRKLYGSALADLHGIHAASSGLRHTDIRTTSEFYVDSRARLTAGFGSVLSEPAVVPLPKPADVPAATSQARP